MLDYQKTRHAQFEDVRHSYTSRDTILYALGIGMGSDPLDRSELRFVYEKDLQVVPVMASVLASPGFWMRERKELGIDAVKLVHGEQSVTLHAALPAEGTVIGRTRVTRIVDKGEGKGAIIQTEKQLFDAATDQLLATVEQAVFCRGDGGFSKAGGGDDASRDDLRRCGRGCPSRRRAISRSHRMRQSADGPSIAGGARRDIGGHDCGHWGCQGYAGTQRGRQSVRREIGSAFGRESV